MNMTPLPAKPVRAGGRFTRQSLALHTEAGTRKNNEDFCGFLVSPDRSNAIAVLSDGMGGHASGEVASKLTVQVLLEAFQAAREPSNPEEELYESILSAHAQILREAARDERKEGMGATVVAVLLRAGKVTVGHVGDSRALQFRGNLVRRLTEDHLFAVEVLGLAENVAKHHPNGHVLTQALGTASDIKPRISQFDLAPNDCLVLCSDGVSEYLDEQQMCRYLLTGDLALAAQKMVNRALELGSKDNCSAIVIKVP